MQTSSFKSYEEQSCACGMNADCHSMVQTSTKCYLDGVLSAIIDTMHDSHNHVNKWNNDDFKHICRESFTNYNFEFFILFSKILKP